MEKNSPNLILICASAIAIIVGLVVIANAYLVEPVKVNAIEPDTSLLGTPAMPVSHTLPFGKENVTISLAVNSSVYAGAKNTDKRIFTHVGVPYATWEAASARSMIGDPAQDELFTDLIGQFRTIRIERNLTSDEYVELLAAYAQSIEYRATDNPAKYPVETVYDRVGDCDDKSLLLAGLLSREGYKVALLLFEKDKHMVVGIGADDNLYLDTGYAYVDIMDYSFIGVPVNRLRGAKMMYLDPVTIPIGSGTMIYRRGSETRFISDRTLIADNRSGTLALQMKEMPQDTAENISVYEQTRRNFFDYSAIYTYIIRHRFDRPGVYEYLKREMPA